MYSDKNHIVDDINLSIFKYLKDNPTSDHRRFEFITKDIIRSSFNCLKFVLTLQPVFEFLL